jgi:hypothetical protein
VRAEAPRRGITEPHHQRVGESQCPAVLDAFREQQNLTCERLLIHEAGERGAIIVRAALAADFVPEVREQTSKCSRCLAGIGYFLMTR